MLSETLSMLQRDPASLTRGDIVSLRDIIQYHRAQYYADYPVITDDEFDRLYAFLVAGEERFDMHDSASPTQEVARLDKDNHFTKARHMHQMMSLDNTYNADDLREFEKRIDRIIQSTNYELRTTNYEYIVEYKFDGLGIALLYEEGKLTRALTR